MSGGNCCRGGGRGQARVGCRQGPAGLLLRAKCMCVQDVWPDRHAHSLCADCTMCEPLPTLTGNSKLQSTSTQVCTCMCRLLACPNGLFTEIDYCIMTQQNQPNPITGKPLLSRLRLTTKSLPFAANTGGVEDTDTRALAPAGVVAGRPSTQCGKTAQGIDRSCQLLATWLHTRMQVKQDSSVNSGWQESHHCLEQSLRTNLIVQPKANLAQMHLAQGTTGPKASGPKLTCINQ